MDAIIAPNTVPLAQADGPPGTGTPGYATNGNPAAQIAATKFPAYHYNGVVRELLAVITAAGLAPSGANLAQVLAAIRALIAQAVGAYLPLAGGNLSGGLGVAGAVTASGNVTGGAFLTTGDIYTSQALLTGPTNGNITPCSAAATGVAVAGGQVNAYNQAGSAGQFGTANAGDVVDFWVGNVATISIQGKITTTGTGVVYGTTSDHRLKQDVVPLTGALDLVGRLQAKEFAFKADPATRVYGFIAHESQDVVPQSVAGVKDAVDDKGRVMPQTMDAARLVPVLWAAVGELKAAVAAQEATIAALRTAAGGAIAAA